MVSAALNFDRQFWPRLVIGAVFVVWLARAAVADDHVIDVEVADPEPDRVQMLRLARAQPGFALSRFNQTVFGGMDGTSIRQFSQILQDRIMAVDALCGALPGVARKLELAGHGDIKRLRDRIDELRKEFLQFDERGDRQVPVDLMQRANELRRAIESGPFDGNSMFENTLKHLFDADQQLLYRSFRELDRRGGKVQTRHCGGRDITVIRMTNAALTDDGLTHFAPLTRLKGILLDYTQVTDEGLAHLGGLTNLEFLDLGSTQIRDAGLAHLERMPRLKMLDLRRTPVTDAALVHLRKLSDLESLNLGHTRVTGKGLIHLATLNRLETLLLDHTAINDESLAYLPDLPKLKMLSLEGTLISDAGLAHLVRLTSLESLNIRGTGATDKCLVHLTRLPNLQVVDLNDTGISPAARGELQKTRPGLTVVK